MPLKFAFQLKKTSAFPLETDKNGLCLKGVNGSLILLIHGLTGSPYETWYLAKFLNRKGYSVVCPRLANHGEPLVVLKKTTWQQCYQSVRQAFLAIKPTPEQGAIFASGLSVGALLALLLADEFPNKISGVSCLSPTLFYDGWNSTKWRHLLPLAYLTPLKNFFYFKEEPPYGIKNETIRQRIHEFYHHASLENMTEVGRYGYPFYPLTLLYQVHLLVKYFKKKLPQIHTPVQLIQAQEDDMTSVKNSQYIYDRIKSEKKEMFLLDDSYHVITADQQKETVAVQMQRFFDEVSARMPSLRGNNHHAL